MRLRLVAFSATIIGTLAFTTSAPADPRPEQHCTADVTRKEVACYATFAEVSNAISGAADSPLVLGILYTDFWYGGSTFTVTGSSGCSGTKDYEWEWDWEYQLWRHSEWANVVSSIRGFSGCWVKVYETPTESAEWNRARAR